MVRQDLLDAGKVLVERLIADGHAVAAAFWFHVPEADQWRLALSLPNVTEKGIDKAFDLIGRTIEHGKSRLSILDIAVVVPNDPVVQAVIQSTGRVPAKSGAWVTVPSSSATTTSTSVIGSFVPDHIIGFGKPST